MTREELDKLSYEFPIIFFDGVCGFCSRSLDWIINADKNESLRYCTLQDGLGQSVNKELGMDDNIDTVIGLYNGRYYTESDVTILICDHLGGGYKMISVILRCIPSFIRNGVYGLIAKYRYNLMGKTHYCYMPSPSTKSLFVCGE